MTPADAMARLLAVTLEGHGPFYVRATGSVSWAELAKSLEILSDAELDCACEVRILYCACCKQRFCVACNAFHGRGMPALYATTPYNPLTDGV